jgi:hypothetical protein
VKTNFAVTWNEKTGHFDITNGEFRCVGYGVRNLNNQLEANGLCDSERLEVYGQLLENGKATINVISVTTLQVDAVEI